MKEYDILAIGSGSAVSVVGAWLDRHPAGRAAVIDKDTPGGICLTRGCIPSKMLTSVADVVRTIERAEEFGVSTKGHAVDFAKVMTRLRDYIDPKIRDLRNRLSQAANLDYYHESAEFVGPSVLRTQHGVEMRSPRILLGLGSEPILPDIPGLRESAPLTTDEVFGLEERPERLAILGGGYIAAEFAHFFSSVGTQVTVVGRNPRFLPQEDAEISDIVTRGLGKRVRLVLGRRPDRVDTDRAGKVTLRLPATERAPRELVRVDRVLVAAGRGPTTRYLHPERAGVRTDSQGWIVVNQYLETGRSGIWALGDATGNYPFKHKANYDAKILHEAIVLGRRTAVDYRAVPHAVFTDPEVASVGLNEGEAVDRYGRRGLLVGRCDYEDTAKGHAIGAGEGRVKVLVRPGTLEIVGAHIVGPQASVLIQEVVNLLYTADRSARAIVGGMHIHPALSEVVEKAFQNVQSLDGPGSPVGTVHRGRSRSPRRGSRGSRAGARRRARPKRRPSGVRE